MEYETHCWKGRDGWKAESNVILGDRIVKVSTWKGSRSGVEVNVSVGKKTADGVGWSHMLFGDFSKTVYTANGKCTAKLVRATHDAAMNSMLPDILEQVRAFYAAKGDPIPAEAA